MNKKDLILFDWDRTISDVEGPNNQLLKQIFSIFGEQENFDNFLSTFRSPENQGRKILDRLKNILGNELGELYFSKFLELKSIGIGKPSIFKGLIEEIKEISSFNNRLIGLVTNKNLSEVTRENLSEVEKYFNFMIGGDNLLENLLKPSGFLIDEVIEYSKENINKIIMIGDTSNDLNSLGNSNNNFNKLGILATWGISNEERKIQLNRVDKTKLKHIVEVNEVSNLSLSINKFINN